MLKKFLMLIPLCVSPLILLAGEFRPRNPMLFTGSIQFPKTLTTIPADLRIYCAGNIITCQIDNKGKRVLYTIPTDRSQERFFLLIVEPDSLDMVMDENTVKYWKIKPRRPYKFYTLTLKEIVSESPQNRPIQTDHLWLIKEERLPLGNTRIPDTAIIICYNPSFVNMLRGGNVVRLPEVIIKPEISEFALHAQSTEILVSCLDIDALHAKLHQKIKHDPAIKTTVTLTT